MALLVAECPPESNLVVECTVDVDDSHKGKMHTLAIPTPAPEWLQPHIPRDVLEGTGKGPKDKISTTGVILRGAVRLSRRGLLTYQGRLTAWPHEARCWWDIYARPLDSVSLTVAQTWKLQEPITLHHRRNLSKNASAPFSNLTAALSNHLFEAWPPALEGGALPGEDGTTLAEVLARWGSPGFFF